MMRRLVFMGSDGIALPALEWLAGEGAGVSELVAIFTQPDRPSGRGHRLAANPIKRWAEGRGLPVHQPEKLTPAALELLRAHDPAAVLVMAYGHLLRQEWLDAPPFGIWNLHASLLPKFRGASPIQSAIAAGEEETGVALMRMVRRLDAGPVLDVERVVIEPSETGESLEAKIAAACPRLLARSWARALTADPPLQPQDETAASYCRRLNKADGALDFSAPAVVLARRINALFPWPGAFFVHEGENIRVGLAEAVSAAAGPEGARSAVAVPEPGTVLPDAAALAIATGAGVLRLLRLQRPGGRMLSAAEFLRGYHLLPGAKIASMPMLELVSDRPFR